jgi:signal transduction histidine kinase
MRQPSSWMVATLTALLLVASASLFGPAHASTPQASVLILLPGQPGLPTASLIATGIRSTLLSEWSFRISLETEIVDIDRFATPEEQENRLRELHVTKYKDRPFDLVITASHSPLRFALRVRDELWPGVPIIACALDERGIGAFTVPPGVTVVPIRFDMEGTLRLALTLLPDTERIALVGGAAPQDRFVHDLARTAVRHAGRPLELIDLTTLSLVDLVARVSTLPEHTVVLASSYQMDASGRRLYGLEMIEPLARAANRPTFNMFAQTVGRGIVGGSVIDFEAVGREAAALGLRVLRGETLPPSPVASTVASVPRFDGRQLERWDLDERRLPAGSEVLFRQTTLWQQYRWPLVGVLAVIGIQAALIVALLVQRRHRREAQTRLAARLRFDALVSEIGAELTLAPAARVDAQISASLQRVGTFFGVDRAELWQSVADGALFEVTHSWSADGIPPMPRGVGVMSRGVTTECAAPGAACPFAAIPLHGGDRPLGFLTLTAVRGDRGWPADVMPQLRTVAEHFASAVVRARSAAALQSSTALTAAVVAALPGETAIIDAKGTILQTNDAWASAALSGPAVMAPRLSVGANYLETCESAIGIPPDTGAKVVAGVASVLRGDREEFSLEYPTPRNGQDRWLELRVRRLTHLRGEAAVTYLDVTKRRRDDAAAQRDLGEIAHLDRVAALGHLASSIAHELNQPLTAILANAQTAGRLLARTPPDLGEVQACLVDIISDDRRAADVIRHMRGLLKKTDFVAVPIALNDLAATTIGLVTNEALLHGVSIEFTPAAAVPIVSGDLVQIQQVILNLLNNAIVAAADGRSVRKVVVWTTVLSSEYVELGVHDSGRGIEDDHLPRLFEPFFTTRSDGLGMGLAIAHRIIEAHDGYLQAENHPAGGAAFRIHLRIERPDAEPR